MNTFVEILRHWSRSRSEPVALATVVRTSGSTYRKPGARMLVQADGTTAGMVSAGCLEKDIAERAMRTIRGEASQLVAYDTRRLFGCNGRMEVFIECVPPNRSDSLLAAAEKGLGERRPLVGTTIFKANDLPAALLGSQALLGHDGQPAEGRPLPERMYADARGALAAETAVERSYFHSGGIMAALLQTIAPPVKVYVFGAHPDVVPLTSICLQLGWLPVVVAHPSQELPVLPPGSEGIYMGPEEVAGALVADVRSAAVVMTHNYGRDLAYLDGLLRHDFRYVGLMGPARRRNQLVGDLAGHGTLLDAPMMERLHGPAGLDIGADGPAEIAMSIASEIKAVMSGRAGGLLRESPRSIHAASKEFV
ncbi:MAG: hypothetical protein JWO94_648 [Verrucomicrobiaceae bacterium]|nr:hypothetical protein [Verrucomicrobiaceae bacterium]